MEINKFKENLKLSRKDREFNYWSEIYNQAYKNLDFFPAISKEVIVQNKSETDRLIEKYPFYRSFMDLIKDEADELKLKSKIVNLIISYLEIINEDGNILVEKGNLKSISKKVYGNEKNKILKDINLMLYEGFFFKKIYYQSHSSTENSLSTVRLINDTQESIYENVIIDISKWKVIINALSEDGIIKNECEWVGLGANLSKPATQLAVFVYLLEDNGIFKIMNQNKQIPEIGELFNVNLSSSRYSQVKKGFKDSEGVSKHMMHFSIYEKLTKYFH